MSGYDWDGTEALIVEEARKTLQMRLADPGMATLQRLVESAIGLVFDYVDWSAEEIAATAIFPSVMRDGAILALVEAYRRKDLSYGVVASSDGDNVAFRVSADWLAGQIPQLHNCKRRFGVA